MYVSLTTPLAIPSRTVCRYATRVQNPPQSDSPPVATTPTRCFSFRASETLLPQTSSVFPRLSMARRGGDSLPEAASRQPPTATRQPPPVTTTWVWVVHSSSTRNSEGGSSCVQHAGPARRTFALLEPVSHRAASSGLGVALRAV